MLASACLPFLFQAVEVDGENYWDGGFVGNPAIYPLIYACDTSSIVIVQLTVMNRNRLPLTAQEVIERHKEITYNACLMREMRTIDFVTSLIEKGIIQDKSIKKKHKVSYGTFLGELMYAHITVHPDIGYMQYVVTLRSFSVL